MKIEREHVEVDSLSAKQDQYESTTWRLLIHPADDGPTNMAIDEAILEAVAAGIAPPTLRFYAWDPACLSLGLGQRVSDVDRDRLSAHGWGLVRRITGGRAILHTDELTYSVTVPADDLRVAGDVKESYRRLCGGLLAGLGRVGADAVAHTGRLDAHRQGVSSGPVCFEVPSDYEITAYGKKLLGSAQTRRCKVVLQHGTLPLQGDLGRICDVLDFDSEANRQEARSRVKDRAITLADVLGQPVDYRQATDAMAEGFAAALNVELGGGALIAWEVERAQVLHREKYAAEGWTGRR